MNPINCWRKFKRVLMLTWRRNNSSFQGKLSNSPTLVENWPLPYALVRVPEHQFFMVKRATTKDAESWCRKLGASLAVFGVANSAMLRDCRNNSWRQLTATSQCIIFWPRQKRLSVGHRSFIRPWARFFWCYNRWQNCCYMVLKWGHFAIHTPPLSPPFKVGVQVARTAAQQCIVRLG